MGSPLAHAYALRARLRPHAVNHRVRDCGRLPISPQPAIVVHEYASRREAWWLGILRCARQHSCPVCAAKRAAERADELSRMMRGDVPEARWQMVTLTLRHNNTEPLKLLLNKLMSSWRRVRATRAVREIFSDRVTASVRSVEVTYGRKNGWHPHIHLLLRTTEWTAREVETLRREWLRLTRGNLKRGVYWSEPAKGGERWVAQYLNKLGAEIAGVSKKARRGRLTHWQLAERSLDDVNLVPRWRESQETMRGRRILEFDERAKALLEQAPEPEQPTPASALPIAGSSAFRCRSSANCIKTAGRAIRN